jgi:hypothetical protein
VFLFTEQSFTKFRPENNIYDFFDPIQRISHGKNGPS